MRKVRLPTGGGGEKKKKEKESDVTETARRVCHHDESDCELPTAAAE